MKITGVEINPVILRKDDKEWRFASGGGPESQGCTIVITTDEGFTGLGYAGAAAHHGVTTGGLQAALAVYGAAIAGLDPFDTEKIMAMLDRTLHANYAAQSGIDIALHDLQAKKLGIPLYNLLGGLVREEIPVIRVLGLKEPANMAENALKLLEQGYAYLKIKVGGDKEWEKDLARVREIREAVGAGIHLMVDANQSYTPKIAIKTLNRMEEWNVDLCEQPVKAMDWQGLAAVSRSVDMAVEAHESIDSLESVFALVQGRIVDSINLKVGQIGGLSRAKTAAAICKLGNVSMRVGMTGTRLLAAVSMHLIASTENVSYACEVGEFSRIVNDPFTGIEVERGMLKVPKCAGIGVTLHE
jgi:L-alanine-DL-glutamate epimerase-like enolase superfamily enzyme